ncbi:MAG: hypothetical protein HC849_25820 [Oscillatoriales cyanobacterium RU_3_3]|nr:hypothetical protein [Oscillatoriales cyanobacterium RU_3_3]
MWLNDIMLKNSSNSLWTPRSPIEKPLTGKNSARTLTEVKRYSVESKIKNSSFSLQKTCVFAVDRLISSVFANPLTAIGVELELRRTCIKVY